MGRRWKWNSSRELKEELCRRGIRVFSHESLRLATRDFKTLIGKGGSSNVYRGVLHDGMLVAVKVYRSDSPDLKQGFVEVIEVFSHIQHRNLNRVIGCCVDKDDRMVVSEYIDNGTLYDLIGDSDRRRSIFSWEKRLALCIGIARGISYLHHDIHPRVIHRDIKPSNILLDANLTPKITDFELAGFVYKDQDLPLEDTVAGTCGYVDPEYFMTGNYTQKTDVYAFGVILLEVVSGRRAFRTVSDFYSDDDSWICRWAARLVADDRKLDIVDPILTDFPKDDALHLIDVALLCTQRQSEPRPSMPDVLVMLSGVCHQPLRGVHLCASVDSTFIQHYYSAVIPTNVEDDGEYSSFTYVASNSEVIDQGEPDGESAENEQIEQGGQDRTREQSNGATASQTRLFPGNTNHHHNNNNVCLEAVYPPFRTRVFTRNTTTSTTSTSTNVFPEAVYPPFRTRVFRRLGSRNLYACEPRAQSQDDILARVSQTAVFTNRSRNVFPEAVYPPFQTGEFRRHGARNLYTFSTLHSVS